MNQNSPEIQDAEERLARAREALREYAATDPDIPVGGLQPHDYERWRYQTEDLSLLNPQQHLERGWLELEYAMAMLRGGIDRETEEPYDKRKINTTFSEARNIFAALARNESAPPAQRMQARMASASVFMHQEIVTGKSRVLGKGTPKHYLPYLSALHSAAAEMLNDPQDGYEELLHMIEIMAPLTAQVFVQNWYVPAAPRQPWDVTIHSAERGRPDIPVVINRAATRQTDLPIHTSTLSKVFKSDDEFIAARTYARLGPEYAIPKGTGRHEVRANWDRAMQIDLLCQTAQVLVDQINSHLDFLKELGVRPADDIIEEETNRPPAPREIFPEITWYLTEYGEQTLRGVLEAHVTLLERHRQNEGLWSDEQRILGWMQRVLAEVTALDGDYDTAREGFGRAMDTFIRAQRMFMRERRPGDAHDAVLAQAATEIHRALYTSRTKNGEVDRYALRRAVTRYIGQVSEIFASANKIKAEGDQQEVVKFTIDRATLILLQAAANEELRHIILPNSPHISDVQDAIALHILYDAKASGYDMTAPVSIKLTEGSEIIAGNRTVSVGREAFTVFGTTTELLRELTALVNPGQVKAAVGKGASKKKKQQPKVSGKSRSDEVEELSEELAYAISDAYEAVL